MKDHYATLGVSQTANQEDIKTAFRRLAVRYHPDVSKEPDCDARFSSVNEAYSTLSDPVARASYDIERANPVGAAMHTATHQDPFYEMLRRHRETTTRGARAAYSREQAESRRRWEQEKMLFKQEAREYRERRQRVHSRMHRAHTFRIAKALSTQWPAHTGLTRQDVLAASLFGSGFAMIAWFWSQVPQGIATLEPVPVEAPAELAITVPNVGPPIAADLADLRVEDDQSFMSVT